LSATIQDISAADASTPIRGDVRNAKVSFIDREAGDKVLCSNLPVGWSVRGRHNRNGDLQLEREHRLVGFSLVHDRIVVDGYYDRNDSGDNAW